MPTLKIIDVFFLLLAVYYLRRLVHFLKSKPSAQVPPGPQGYPVIGNLFNMLKPAEKPWETYSHWIAEYGSIFSLTIFNKRLVILNDAELATEMLDKKGTIYVNRPQQTMYKLCNLDSSLALTQYDDVRFKKYRKMFSGVLGNAQALQRFYPIEEYQSSMLLKRILDHPDDFKQAISKTTGALVLQVTYGYNVKEGDNQDPLVLASEFILKRFGEINTPGRFLVDFLPCLQHVPSWFPFFGSIHRYATEVRIAVDLFLKDGFEFAKQDMQKGSNVTSYVSELLAAVNSDDYLQAEEEFNVIKWAAGSLVMAGVDTTAFTIMTYFLVATAYPEVQHELQAEIDRVIGKDRLPSLEDKKNGCMPYLNAVVKELFRWMPVVPLGVPHQSTTDDIHNSYLIPQGSIVFPNIWFFLHDPTRYKDPMKFRPDRFLGPEPERDPYDFCFGYGRRICPGLKLADLSVWINVAKVAATLQITKAKTKDGNFVEPILEQTADSISQPVTIKCHIESRYAGAEGLIETSIRELSQHYEG